MIIFLVTMLGTQQLSFSLREPVMNWLALHDGSPGQEPPWYFINRDFAEGICSSAALALSLLVAALSWRWWPDMAKMMTWFSLISNGGNVAKGWVIYRYCPGLADGQRSTTRWPSFDSYLNDPLIHRLQSMVLWGTMLFFVVLPLAIGLMRKRWNKQKA
ncbi:hypothetical protein [Haloferula sp. BvORR071]|uniref:hypothetical protein n=1 Tax=Haloferula sp. BvORR071 TaxID=1396141 RepID=UPI0005539E2F|nr:hypothetical protein [Haloferula sp. BvORR071]